MAKHTVMFAKIILILTALIWGSSFFVMKIAAGVFPTPFLMAVRYTAGTAVLAVLFFPRLSQLRERRYMLGAVTTGVTQMVAYLLQTLGLAWDTSPGKSAFLTAAYCVFVPFITWLLLRRRPSGWQFLAAFICISGIGLLSLTESLSISPGDAVTLLGSIVTVLNIIAISRAGMQGCDPILLTIGQLGVAGILSWCLTLLSGSFLTASPPLISWISLIGLGVIASALCLVMQAYGLKHVEPTQGSLILSLESVFGVLTSVLFYGEMLTPRLIAGFFLTFCSIFISETELKFLFRGHDYGDVIQK